MMITIVGGRYHDTYMLLLKLNRVITSELSAFVYVGFSFGVL